tara:strand:- start:80 stop:658 length:579 start_codon:yes stop_codon:yes gene_type:complete
MRAIRKGRYPLYHKGGRGPGHPHGETVLETNGITVNATNRKDRKKLKVADLLKELESRSTDPWRGKQSGPFTVEGITTNEINQQRNNQDINLDESFEERTRVTDNEGSTNLKTTRNTGVQPNLNRRWPFKNDNSYTEYSNRAQSYDTEGNLLFDQNETNIPKNKWQQFWNIRKPRTDLNITPLGEQQGYGVD